SAAEPTDLTWRAGAAWCLAEAGERDRVSDLLRRTTPEAAAAVDENYLWWATVAGFADAVAIVGDPAWAEALSEMIAPFSGHNCTLGVASFNGAADHWLGVLATTCGRFEDAE